VGVGVLGGAVPPAFDAEPSPWESGQYRDFTPEVDAPDGGVSVRALGPGLKLIRALVHRPRIAPGGLASLRAHYTVRSPSGPTVVKETRIIRFNDTILTTLTRVASRASGNVSSEYQFKIPPDAAEGAYTLTTIVEHAPSATRSGAPEEENTKNTIFFDDNAPGPPAPADASHGDRPVTIKLSANKSKYRTGETVTISFEANKDAYVTLVNVGTSGAITILYPNRFSGGNAVKAHQPYLIPGR